MKNKQSAHQPGPLASTGQAQAPATRRRQQASSPFSSCPLVACKRARLGTPDQSLNRLPGLVLVFHLFLLPVCILFFGHCGAVRPNPLETRLTTHCCASALPTTMRLKSVSHETCCSCSTLFSAKPTSDIKHRPSCVALSKVVLFPESTHSPWDTFIHSTQHVSIRSATLAAHSWLLRLASLFWRALSGTAPCESPASFRFGHAHKMPSSASAKAKVCQRNRLLNCTSVATCGVPGELKTRRLLRQRHRLGTQPSSLIAKVLPAPS